MDASFNPQPKPARPKIKPVRRRSVKRLSRSRPKKTAVDTSSLPYGKIRTTHRRRVHDTTKKDRAFQESGETHWCEVGHYSEQTCYHHIKGRRYKETRWDKDNCIRLCFQHHAEIHQLGPTRFCAAYPALSTMFSLRTVSKRT